MKGKDMLPSLLPESISFLVSDQGGPTPAASPIKLVRHRLRSQPKAPHSPEEADAYEPGVARESEVLIVSAIAASHNRHGKHHVSRES